MDILKSTNSKRDESKDSDNNMQNSDVIVNICKTEEKEENDHINKITTDLLNLQKHLELQNVLILQLKLMNVLNAMM